MGTDITSIFEFIFDILNDYIFSCSFTFSGVTLTVGSWFCACIIFAVIILLFKSLFLNG